MIDRLINWYQERRVNRAIANNPELTEFRVKSLEYSDNTIKLIGRAPTLLAMIRETGKILKEEGCKNYLEFKALCLDVYPPRVVRVTLQWDDGESPGDRAARLEEELKGLKGDTSQ